MHILVLEVIFSKIVSERIILYKYGWKLKNNTFFWNSIILFIFRLIWMFFKKEKDMYEIRTLLVEE